MIATCYESSYEKKSVWRTNTGNFHPSNSIFLSHVYMTEHQKTDINITGRRFCFVDIPLGIGRCGPTANTLDLLSRDRTTPANSRAYDKRFEPVLNVTPYKFARKKLSSRVEYKNKLPTIAIFKSYRVGNFDKFHTEIS